LRNLIEMVDGAILTDNSGLEKIVCPREWEYAIGLKRVSANEKPALNFGQSQHHVLEWRYANCGNDEVLPEQQVHQLNMLEKFFDENPQSAMDFRQLPYAKAMLEAYNHKYRKEPFKVMEFGGKRVVEASFALPLGEISPPLGRAGNATEVVYTGKIDLGISNNEGIWVVDHKTTFQFGSQFEDEMTASAQMPGYCWAFQKIFGAKPEGVLINALRVRRPSTEMILSQDPTYGLDDQDFMRLPLYKSQENIDEWAENTLAIVEELAYYNAKGYFPQKKKWCARKYGTCQFYAACNTIPRESREHYLASPSFEDNVWTPLNKVKEEQNGK
jgi:hypothetical protein